MNKNPSAKHKERVLFTLSSDVVENVNSYAKKIRKGNKSGFVADAIEAYIKLLKKKVETERLRESYKAAAEDSFKIHQEWRFADSDVEQALRKMESEKE